MSDLTLGIIGLGVGRKYAEAARKHGCDVVLCDVDREKLEAAARDLGAKAATLDWHEMVADERVDAIVVATPDALHRPMVLESLRQGKHVLCEPPLDVKRAGAELIADAALESGVHVLVAHRLRFHPLMRKMKEELPRVGELGLLEARWIRSRQQAPSGWRLDPELKRHLVIGEAIDVVDALRWLAGEIYEVVGFATNKLHQSWPVADTIVSAGRFVNRAALHAVFSVAGDVPNVTWFAAQGERGALTADLEAGELSFHQENGWELIETSGGSSADLDLESEILNAFLGLLGDSSRNPCSVVDGVGAVVAAIALKDSAQVNLPARIRPFQLEDP